MSVCGGATHASALNFHAVEPVVSHKAIDCGQNVIDGRYLLLHDSRLPGGLGPSVPVFTENGIRYASTKRTNCPYVRVKFLPVEF